MPTYHMRGWAACRQLWQPSRRAMSISIRASAADAAPAQPPRLYVPQRLAGQPPGWLCRLDPSEARHAKTLRLQPGAHVELCDGQGSLLLAEVAGVGKEGTVVRTLGEARQVPVVGWQWRVAAACGSLKGGRGDWLVEKCVELGAAGFVPLVTQRSPIIGSSSHGSNVSSSSSSKRSSRSEAGKGRRDKGGGSAALQQQEEEGAGEEGWLEGAGEGGREGRWQRLAAAALKQSLRAHAMRVYSPLDVLALCGEVRAADVALVGVAGAPPISQIAATLQREQNHQQQQQQQQGQGQGQEPRAGGRPGEGSGAEGSRREGGSATLAPQSMGRVRQGLLIVGPEGDFTPGELEQLLTAGATPVGLGDLRLRAETAAIALLAYAQLQFASP